MFKRFVPFLATIFCALSLFPTTAAESIAVLIGTGNSRELMALGDMLVQRGFDRDHVDLLTGRSETTLEALELLFDELVGKAEADDLLFIALSGHCCTIGKKLFFGPTDTDFTKIRTLFPVSEYLEKIKSKRVILLVEPVFSGISSGNIVPLTIENLDKSSIPEHVAFFFQDNGPSGNTSTDTSVIGYFTDVLKGPADLNRDGKIEVRELLRLFEIHPDRLLFKAGRFGSAWDDEFFVHVTPLSRPTTASAPVELTPVPTPVPAENEDKPPCYNLFLAWNAHSGKRIVSVSFFPGVQEPMILSGGEDNTVQVHKVSNLPKTLLRIPFADEITSVALDATGERFLVSLKNMTVELWKIEEDDVTKQFSPRNISDFNLFHEKLHQLHPKQRGVLRVAFDQPNRKFLVVSAEAVCIGSDSPNGDALPFVIRGDGALRLDAAAAVFLPESNSILAAFANSPIALYRQQDASEKPNLDCQFRHPGVGVGTMIYDLAVAPDERKFVSAGSNNKAILWSLDSETPLFTWPHGEDVTAAAFSPDGQHVLTGSLDGTAILWDVESGKQIQKFDDLQTNIWSVAFSPDGRYIAIGLDNGHIAVYKK